MNYDDEDNIFWWGQEKYSRSGEFIQLFLVAVCSSFFVLGLSPDFSAYGAIFVDLGFSVVFAN